MLSASRIYLGKVTCPLRVNVVDMVWPWLYNDWKTVMLGMQLHMVFGGIDSKFARLLGTYPDPLAQ
jgi:hypothetical protein